MSFHVAFSLFYLYLTASENKAPSLLRPIFFKRHSVSPHKVIKYMIWSIAAPAAKQFYVPCVGTTVTPRILAYHYDQQ
jgi:hypothetical protein